MASKDIIHRLTNAGLTYAEIARRVGRDSSLISQIAKGKKPGKNLEGALEDIAEGRAVREIQRRRTAGGELAKTRKSKKTGEPTKLLKDKKGRIKHAPDSERPSVLLDRVGKIATAGGKVSFVVTYEDSEGNQQSTKLFEKGGAFAQRVIYQMKNHEGGSFGWILDELLKKYVTGEYLDVQRIVSVRVNASY